MTSPSSLGGPAADPSSTDEWQATRAQTQVHADKEEYLASDHRDIGRQVSSTQRELFVSCDPAEALQQQFEHLRPEFIALHDIGTASSRKLLAGVAAAAGRKVQKLVIRRQGYGTSLATLEFLDFTASGNSLRIYTTEADADTVERHELARVLLAYSRLGVVMVGDLPPHLLTSSLDALREAMITGNWPNRNLLLLPLAQAGTLTSLGADMGRGTGVMVTTTPLAMRPAQAWGFLSGTWNRLREQLAATGLNLPGLPGTSQAAGPANASPSAAIPLDSMPAPLPRATSPASATLDMQPMPTIRNNDSRTADPLLSRYVHQLIELTGMVSCCVFDVSTGKSLAHAGAKPGPDELALHGATLLSAIHSTGRALGLGHAQPDTAITLGAHHLLLRPVPHHPGLAMHAVLDKTHANLTLTRLQVGRMDSMLEPVR